MQRIHRTTPGARWLPSLIVGLWALLSLSSPAAHAYSWSTCEGDNIVWNDSWTNMYMSTTSFPPSTAWDALLQNAMWHWNNVQGAGFTFYVGRDTDGTHSSSNGVNEIYLSSSEVGDALAVTFTRYHCYWFFGWNEGIDETDIAFNSNLGWSVDVYDYANPGGSPYNFEGVALHELGHALGLDHEDRWMATMNSYYPNSGPLGYYREWDPLADDRQGVRALYPDGTAETDIAASPLKSTGPGSSDLVASPVSAARGASLTLEFTFANLGTALAAFDIGFYLSTNDYISTLDTLLGINYGAWADPGFTGTFARTLDIPHDTPAGTYYLGFIVDPYNGLVEDHEGNGFQPLPRVIEVY